MNSNTFLKILIAGVKDVSTFEGHRRVKYNLKIDMAEGKK